MDDNPLTVMLRSHVRDLVESANSGNADAQAAIHWYEMHRRCPGDQVAMVVCEESFKAWQKNKETAP